MKPHLPGLPSPEQAAKATSIVVATIAELAIKPVLFAYDVGSKAAEVGTGVLAALTGCNDPGDHR